MAVGLLGTGISGLLSANTALATTSQNIVNVATEGYSRQRANLVAREAQPYGGGFIGNGVTLGSIERIYDQFLTTQIRTSSSGYNELNRYHELATQIDNVLADPAAGLMPTLEDFFSSIQDVADDPVSSAARQAMLGSAQTLVDRFNYLDKRFNDLGGTVKESIKVSVLEINEIASAVASINNKISEAKTLGNGEPNDLLDKRDSLILELSQRINVTVTEQDNGSLNVFIGSGQSVVAGFESFKLITVPNQYDPSRLNIAFETPGGSVDVTDQLSGGSLGGILNFRSKILDRAQIVLGSLAMGMAETFNEQHKKGMDLRGLQGEDFFTDISQSSPTALANLNNNGSPLPVVDVEIDDVSQVKASDYKLFRETSGYFLIRNSDDKTFKLNNLPGSPEIIDGMRIEITTGVMDVGDSFLLSAVGNAARDMELKLKDTSSIAAASLIRSETSLSNAGSGEIYDEIVVDSALYAGETYNVTMAYSTAALADAGATAGILTDAGANSTLSYELRVNNTLVYTQAEGAPALAGNQAIVDAINGAADVNVATTGVKAYLDPVSGEVLLANQPASITPIDISETLITSVGVTEDADTFSGYFGSALTGLTNPSNTVQYQGFSDAYVVADDAGAVQLTGAYGTGTSISVNGVSASLSGLHYSGDSFTIKLNTNGVSDNRNTLLMGELQTELTLNESQDSYSDVYGKLVSEMGIYTYQAEINMNAQEGLLNKSISAREQKSGVNLDEEAANMLRFQQLYKASAQIILAAQTTFDSLMAILRR